MTITTPDAGPAVDVELDILRYGLTEVAREMLDSLMRSAFSPVCRDILDCTSAIHMRTDDGWETVALWEGCMQHAFTAPHIANFVMDEWDIDSMQPGDVIFVNDPWRGTIHQSDVNLLRPVFVDGRWSSCCTRRPTSSISVVRSRAASPTAPRRTSRSS
jgi:N-methylhydantoinase B